MGPSDILACTASKQYDFPPPSCVPVPCGEPNPPVNGYVELSSGGMSYLHNASYVCRVGYEFSTGK